MNTHGARRRADAPISDPVNFLFGDIPIQAYASDTVASALIASGHRYFLEHPNDGTPRGGFCLVGRCSDCLMVIDGQPGVMACQTPVRNGMLVEVQVGLGHWSGSVSQ